MIRHKAKPQSKRVIDKTTDTKVLILTKLNSIIRDKLMIIVNKRKYPV